MVRTGIGVIIIIVIGTRERRMEMRIGKIWGPVNLKERHGRIGESGETWHSIPTLRRETYADREVCFCHDNLYLHQFNRSAATLVFLVASYDINNQLSRAPWQLINKDNACSVETTH